MDEHQKPQIGPTLPARMSPDTWYAACIMASKLGGSRGICVSSLANNCANKGDKASSSLVANSSVTTGPTTPSRSATASRSMQHTA